MKYVIYKLYRILVYYYILGEVSASTFIETCCALLYRALCMPIYGSMPVARMASAV